MLIWETLFYYKKIKHFQISHGVYSFTHPHHPSAHWFSHLLTHSEHTSILPSLCSTPTTWNSAAPCTVRTYCSVVFSFFQWDENTTDPLYCGGFYCDNTQIQRLSRKLSRCACRKPPLDILTWHPYIMMHLIMANLIGFFWMYTKLRQKTGLRFSCLRISNKVHLNKRELWLLGRPSKHICWGNCYI